MNRNISERDILGYCSIAPLALSLERLVEVGLMRERVFSEPIIDLGCGDGIFTKFVLESTESVVGVDLSFNELRFRSDGTECERSVVNGLGANLPFRDETFSTALSNSVLEHIPEIKPVICEVKRVLKVGGQFFVTVPSCNFETYSVGAQVLRFIHFSKISRWYQRTYNKFWNHYHAYSVVGWKELFEECGFSVIDVVGYNGRRTCLLNDALVPFGLLGKIRRRIGLTWVLSPTIRTIFYRLLLPLLKRHVKKSEIGDGLVFFALEKKF